MVELMGHTGFSAYAVCIPRAAPSPRIRIKRARGRSPAGGGPFDLSVTERMPMSRIAVPRNSEKKQAAIVINKLHKKIGSEVSAEIQIK
jgi:hypothetical protein